nr:hypothetical protein [Mycobacterium sp. IDR2000157661]
MTPGLGEALPVIGDQLVFVPAAVAHRQGGDDDVADVVHAVATGGELPIQQAGAAVGQDEGIADVAVAVHQRARQRGLVSPSGIHLLQQRFGGLADRFDQLAFELSALHLGGDEQGHAGLVGEQVVDGSAGMRQDP